MAAESAERWLGGDVRDRPERRRHPRARRRREPRAPHRLHRPPRRAQGAARAAARVARDPPAHRRAAAADRHRPAAVPLPALADALRRRRDRRARDRHERGAVAPSSPRRRLFVSPALGGESFGLVLAEAFATATPVVASDIPGFADVATPETATLVPPGDEARAHRRGRRRCSPTRSAASRWAAPARDARRGALLVGRRRAAARGAVRAGRRMKARDAAAARRC